VHRPRPDIDATVHHRTRTEKIRRRPAGRTRTIDFAPAEAHEEVRMIVYRSLLSRFRGRAAEGFA
jgi:hypothetical protein